MTKSAPSCTIGGQDRSQVGSMLNEGQRAAARAEERETKDRAREIAAAALVLFAERDFASVTIKDIARSIGINTALIYYYFDSKEDLFRFSIESAIRAALENFQRLRAQHHRPADVIADWFKSNADLAETIANLLKIMLDYARSGRSLASVDALIREFYAQECRIIEEAIERGIVQGVFRKVDTRRLALFVSSHLDGIIVASIIRPGYRLRDAFEDLRTVLWRHLEVSG